MVVWLSRFSEQQINVVSQNVFYDSINYAAIAIAVWTHFESHLRSQYSNTRESASQFCTLTLQWIKKVSHAQLSQFYMDHFFYRIRKKVSRTKRTQKKTRVRKNSLEQREQTKTTFVYEKTQQLNCKFGRIGATPAQFHLQWNKPSFRC
jgi:hypothetical protein